MSPDDVVSFWREYYGPTQRAFAALDGQPEKQDEMHKDLSDLWRCANKAIGNVTIVDSEYLKVLITQIVIPNSNLTQLSITSCDFVC